MYKFEPILKTLVWGTESWVLSAVPGSESVVCEGPDKGLRITDIFPGEFPLLIKFIDARRDLSIQVHPDDELAARRHGCKGKDEMWYVVAAGDGARIICGLKEKITPEQYEALVEEGRITEVLDSYDAAAGDVFYLPAGRIHAICAGCYLAEIQETSDITYRIFDYNRPGLDGKPRQLHIQESKDAIDYTVLPDYRTHYSSKPDEENVIVDSPHFVTSLLEIGSEYRKDPSESGPFNVFICLEGGAQLVSESGGRIGISSGQAVLSPKSDGVVRFLPQGSAKFLLTRPR